MAESIAIPKTLLKDLYMGLAKVEEVLATLKELMNKEGLERTRKAEEECMQPYSSRVPSRSKKRSFV